eukprot:TRINITY_DN11025_c0_g1_i1.p1 TRINITY_DN11025_c0_g1~~TRINITY_DN11025_c0_g1_i1.p1  ORF type:complete len:427 (-),score=125.06 TRINITY_DN11025_c0_g1_i1:82-1362(-)
MQTMESPSSQTKDLVRKCMGKKQSDCLQQSDHANTRWECSYETQSKDEYNKHSKNIAKRVKWRELVDNIKPDKDGWYRCVYYSTDRHHVENHYTKGSQEVMSPSPGGSAAADFYRNNPYMDPYRSPYGAFNQAALKKMTSKRWGTKSGEGEEEEDENISPDAAAREVKKMRQDANLFQFFHDQSGQGAENGDKEATDQSYVNPDAMKVEDLVKSIEARTNLDHEMCEQAIDKLHKNGFIVVGSLRNMRKETYERLALPLTLEDEIKSQMSMFNMYYPPMMPYWGFQNGQYSWHNFNMNNSMGGGMGMYYNPQGMQQSYDQSDSVLGEGEVEKKMKEEGESQEMNQGMHGLPTVSQDHGAVGNVSQLEAQAPDSGNLVALSMVSGGMNHQQQPESMNNMTTIPMSTSMEIPVEASPMKEEKEEEVKQ